MEIKIKFNNCDNIITNELLIQKDIFENYENYKDDPNKFIRYSFNTNNTNKLIRLLDNGYFIKDYIDYILENFHHISVIEKLILSDIINDEWYRMEEISKIDLYSINRELVNIGYRLDKFINNENKIIRIKVAKQRYGLNILINDKSSEVVREVLKQSKPSFKK